MNALLSYSDSGGEAGEPGPQAALVSRLQARTARARGPT